MFTSFLKYNFSTRQVLVYDGWIGMAPVTGFLSACCCWVVVAMVLLGFCCPGNTLFADDVAVLFCGRSCCSRCQASICTRRSSSLPSSTSKMQQLELLNWILLGISWNVYTLYCIMFRIIWISLHCNRPRLFRPQNTQWVTSEYEGYIILVANRKCPEDSDEKAEVAN